MSYGWTILGDQFSGPPVCYAAGTKILCENGYRPIEELKPGDVIQTYLHGNLPIECIKSNTFINNPDKWSDCMYKMVSTNPDHEDLIVTGGHGILKERLTPEELKADIDWFNKNRRYSIIDKWYLQRAAFSKDFVKITDKKEYTYYHLSLKSKNGKRYGIWANGILSESTFKKHV